MSALNLLIHEELRITNVFNLHPTHHLPSDDLNMFVVNVDTLKPVNLLNLINEIILQRFLTQNTEDVMWVTGSIHQRLTSSNAVTLLNVYVHTFWQ